MDASDLVTVNPWTHGDLSFIKIDEADHYDDPAQLLANAQRSLMAGATVCDVMRCTPARDIAYANAAAGGLLDIWVTGYDETV